MAETLLVKLPPGALQREPADLVVEWQSADGRREQGSLADLVDTRPDRPLGLVLSAADVQLTSVSLNRRQARHLQKVLPYLLEEQVLGDPDELWFAAGRPLDGRYPVAVCDRQGLVRIKASLEEAGLRLEGAAVDGQLLAARAPLLVEDADESLVLAGADRVIALPAPQLEPTLKVLDVDVADWPKLQGRDAILSALRQAWPQRLELLQGALRPAEHRQRSVDWLPEPWRPVAAFAATALLLAWGLVWLQAWRYDQLAEDRRAEAAALYESLFPGDRATARLQAQFRSRLVRLGGAGGGGGGFLSLIAPVGEALAGAAGEGVRPKRIQFDQREGVLLLDLEAPGYERLESLRASVEAAGLGAEIANFRSQGETVAARMKVGAG